jgi:hypothetical protein
MNSAIRLAAWVLLRPRDADARQPQGNSAIRLAAWVLLLALLTGCTGIARFAGAAAAPTGTPVSCPVTRPNGSLPPGEKPPPPGHPDAHYGNGKLWTALWPSGKTLVKPDQIDPDGTLDMKFPWWRGPGVRGPLTITGRCLDAPAPPLRADIPIGYGDTGFQASRILFPTEGCWEVAGKSGDASLTFVTLVMKAK